MDDEEKPVEVVLRALKMSALPITRFCSTMINGFYPSNDIATSHKALASARAFFPGLKQLQLSFDWILYTEQLDIVEVVNLLTSASNLENFALHGGPPSHKSEELTQDNQLIGYLLLQDFPNLKMLDLWGFVFHFAPLASFVKRHEKLERMDFRISHFQGLTSTEKDPNYEIDPDKAVANMLQKMTGLEVTATYCTVPAWTKATMEKAKQTTK